jgi:hypothetical protein
MAIRTPHFALCDFFYDSQERPSLSGHVRNPAILFSTHVIEIEYSRISFSAISASNCDLVGIDEVLVSTSPPLVMLCHPFMDFFPMLRDILPLPECGIFSVFFEMSVIRRTMPSPLSFKKLFSFF